MIPGAMRPVPTRTSHALWLDVMRACGDWSLWYTFRMGTQGWCTGGHSVVAHMEAIEEIVRHMEEGQDG